MPIWYKIDASRQRVVTHVAVAVSMLDIVGHFKLARREGFPSYCELIDASSIMRPSMSVSDLWKTAGTIRNLHNQERCGARAVWVGDDANFILVRTFAALVSSYIPMQVFRDQLTGRMVEQTIRTRISHVVMITLCRLLPRFFAITTFQPGLLELGFARA